MQAIFEKYKWLDILLMTYKFFLTIFIKEILWEQLIHSYFDKVSDGVFFEGLINMLKVFFTMIFKSIYFMGNFVELS